jgi:hypothetical protein
LSLPNNEENENLTHPRDNYSPEKCSWNQDKTAPVWMLPDGKGINPPVDSISQHSNDTLSVTTSRNEKLQNSGGKGNFSSNRRK